MPIVGDCRTDPFISCAHCRAALRLPGLQERRESVGPVKAQPPPGIEAGTALDVHCRPVTAGRFRSSLVPVAGRRCACPAYMSAQGECRPGKA
ncbi:hypothetical protein FZ928_07975 [Klebsiella pneumoniae]|uniref:Uncharacterized protein n=1 Tax=Klebsiella pneumoniae TaxID=573 RepID=A0A5C2LJG6_KLEPN|nr:hypothetical protein FZ928_07975 [Klebsiella pneumoniae]